jgi:ketosteroid isomerase-like protein
MRTLDELGELRDRRRITDLIHEYCRSLDAMDLDALVQLFTADCTVDYGPEPPLQSHGAQALQRDLARMWRWSRTSHHSSNVQIDFVDADTATACSYVLAWHEAPDGSTATMMGQYRDRLVREPDGWRIAHRRQVMTGNDAGFTVRINRFERLPDPRPR